MSMTVVEKILARAAGLPAVKAGDVVEPKVDLAMSHENAALVINQFLEIYKGTPLPPKIWDPSRVAIDLRSPRAGGIAQDRLQPEEGARVCRRAGLGKFHDIRGDVGGICHQILPENGYVRPGCVVVGTDSHTTSHGALGAFAFGIGATEMASVWALGTVLNVEVPATIKVVVKGRFKKFVGPKDLILHLIGKLSAQGANFKVLEFHGETISKMSTSGRLVAVQHGRRGRRDRGHCAGGRGDGALPARGSRRDRPHRTGCPGRGRSLRERRRDQCLQAVSRKSLARTRWTM